MGVKSKLKSHHKAQPHALHKPRGVIHPRVQAVGPEHFAFLCVDCAKARSKMMLADFYGRVLMEPTTVEHDRSGFETAMKDRPRRDGPAPDQGRDRRRRAHRTLPRTGPARLPPGGLRGPHPPSVHHQAISTARRSRQQDRRHRPLRHPPRRRQWLRPVGARTRPGLPSNSSCWPGTAAAWCESGSCSSSRCSNICNRTCQDIRNVSMMSLILQLLSGWPRTWARPRRLSRPVWPA